MEKQKNIDLSKFEEELKKNPFQMKRWEFEKEGEGQYLNLIGLVGEEVNGKLIEDEESYVTISFEDGELEKHQSYDKILDTDTDVIKEELNRKFEEIKSSS